MIPRPWCAAPPCGHWVGSTALASPRWQTCIGARSRTRRWKKSGRRCSFRPQAVCPSLAGATHPRCGMSRVARIGRVEPQARRVSHEQS
jgi:hypothetical protein